MAKKFQSRRPKTPTGWPATQGCRRNAAALLAAFLLSCGCGKEENKSTEIEVIGRQPSRASLELVVGLGAVWRQGFGGEPQVPSLLRWDPKGEAQAVASWDGDTLVPRLLISESHLYRLNAGVIERHDADGSSSGIFSAKTRARLTQIAGGEGYVVASSESCASIVALNKTTGEVRIIDNNVTVFAGGGWGLIVTETDIFCTGNDYLARVDLETMSLVKWRETSDIVSRVASIHYRGMIRLGNKIYVYVTGDGPGRVVELNPESLEEGPKLNLPEFNSFSRWYPDESGTGFYANFLSLTDSAARIVHVDVGSGEVRQLIPNRPRADVAMGPAFGMDEDFIYWTEIRDGEKLLVRYPRGAFDEPYAPQ